jgi:hypothetical protein
MKIRSTHPIAVVLLSVGLLAASGVPPAAAHEFTVAIVGNSPSARALVAEAVRGFIVATDERDGHASETSDGHLGGLDVQIRLLSPATAAAIGDLVGNPKDVADIVFLLGLETPGDDASGAAIGPDTIAFRPGALPSNDSRDASGFAARFSALHGHAPSEAAAQGYNAARRIDLAIRPLSGLAPRAAIEASLADTAAGINW